MRRGLGSALASVIVAVTAGGAMAQTKIEFITFPGPSGMPVFVAQDKGLFAKEGITVNVTNTPSSGFQMQNLVAGKFQVAQTAIDNQIAYMEGQGTAKLDREPDLITIIGGGSIDLPLVAAASIKSFADLKGKDFALDSLSTGFAFVLRKMLEKNGLMPSDYNFVAVGGTDKRWESMKEGKTVAGLLNEPYRSMAVAAGFKVLGEGLDFIGPYLATVHVVNRAWAKENEKTTVGYVRAVVTAVRWMYDPANRAEATQILMKRLPNTPEAGAARMLGGLLSGRTALEPNGKVDIEGVKTVIALREQYGEPKKKLGAPEKYIDLTYYNKAVGAM
jgi:ABC-type nitrate/sulfonate/bicarbonate transport system substrate-binding protein